MAKTRAGAVHARTKDRARTGAKNTARRKGNALSARQSQPAKPDLTLSEKLEQILIQGDLTPLTTEERVSYYRKVCASLGLNPLTMPFSYISFRENDNAPAKLQLYARKDCSEQLRGIHGVSVLSLKREILDETCIVEVQVRDKNGKLDVGTGIVSLIKWDKYAKPPEWAKLKGREYDNALMKCETKAKRRATLSICGLGFLDETEIEGLANYNDITPGGRVIVVDGQPTPRQLAQESAQAVGQANAEELKAKMQEQHPKKAPIVRKVEIRTLVGDEFAVTGHLIDFEVDRFLHDVSAKAFEAKEDHRWWWRMEDRYLPDFKTLCERLKLEIS